MSGTDHAVDRPQHRRWRHRAHAALPFLYPVLALLVWVRPGTVLNILATAGFLAVIAADLWHRRELCEQCIAAVPLDAAATAERRRHILRLIHHLRPVAGAYAALLLLHLALPGGSAAANVVSSTAYAMSACLVVAQIQHNLLQPWCPWCRRGNGGDDDPEPDPGPTGGLGRPLPVHSTRTPAGGSR
ncbi:hypothetical protein ACPC54_18290 [Kitasatospora sp. NPDC094028]